MLTKPVFNQCANPMPYILNSARSKIKSLAYVSLLMGVSTLANADCDCGSTNVKSPCTAKNLTVTVGSSTTATFSWNFSSDGGSAYCGRFANGDYWIAPKGANLSLDKLTVSGERGLALDANPELESIGLLDGSAKTYGNTLSEQNLLSKLPVSLFKDVKAVPVSKAHGLKQYEGIDSVISLVAAAQRNEAIQGDCGTKQIVGACVDAYSIVTIFPAIPPQNGATMLRPNLMGATKELHVLDDFSLLDLPRMNFFDGPTADTIELIRQRWSNHTEVFSLMDNDYVKYSEGGRAFRAALLVDDYAAGVASKWYDDFSVLLSGKLNKKQMNTAASAMLTYGLDIFKAIYDDNGNHIRYYGSGAGQHLGKFMPPVLFAALAKNSFYAEVVKKESSLLGKEEAGPHELEQVNVTPSGKGIWGDGPDEISDLEYRTYWANLFKANCYDGAKAGIDCNTNGGSKNERDPHGYIDGPPRSPGSSYFTVSIGPQRSMVATMLMMPKVCDVINYDPLVEYVLRVEQHGISTSNDPCAPPDPREDYEECDVYRNSGCKYYGVTWGPRPENPKECIHNQAGQNGRYASRDGKKLSKFGYTSKAIESNWNSIIGVKTSCRVTRPNPVSQTKVLPTTN